MANQLGYDVVIVGGGPAGLSAALALGRARKRALLCDSGPRRNAAAVHMHNFVTQDGTPPAEFRRVARDQLQQYSTVEVRDVRVTSIGGARGAFRVELDGAVVEARRVLLATGMIDEMLPIEGFAELWGHSIFQCPYCHGWEVRERRWGYLAPQGDGAHVLPFVLGLRSWTADVALFTGGPFEVPAEMAEPFAAAGIRLEKRPVARLVARDGALESVELADGTRLPCEILFAHPPQRQVDIVRSLDLAMDEGGYVRVGPASLETSIPGVYAAGDLASRVQAAIVGASSGMQAAARINVDLAMDERP